MDIDGDGDLDLATISLQRVRLLENRMPSRRFARLHLKARKTQHHALGARVHLSAGGVTQQDYVKATTGFQTQVPWDLHFGLGEAAKIEKLRVVWPSGAEQVLTDLPVDRRISLIEGQPPVIEPLPAWPGGSRPRPRESFSLGGDAARVEGGRAKLVQGAKPVILNFWAPWCAACAQELPELAALARADRAELVGVSVEVEDTSGVKAFIAKHRLPYAQFYADDALIASFFGADAELPLPSTFVFDEDRRLVRAFHRPVSRADLDAVLSTFEARALTVDFVRPLAETHLLRGEFAEAEQVLKQGLAARPAAAELWAQLGNAYAMRGQDGPAVEALEKATKLEPRLAYAWYALGVTHKAAGRLPEAVRALERAAAQAPDRVEYAMSLGAAYSQAKDLERAAATFEALVARAPQTTAAWINLGKVRMMLGRPDAAAAFDAALELAPGHPEARALRQQIGPR